MSEVKEILKNIEQLREQLYKVAEGKKFTDPEVVYVSQMLDALLNEYQRLMKIKYK